MSRPNKVLHIIQQLSGGGAGRALVGVAKYSSAHGNLEHRVHSLLLPNDQGLELAASHKIRVETPSSPVELQALIADADIVHVHWWNNPELDALLRTTLPDSRTIGWFHVGGQRAPQILSRDVVEYFDMAIACSPYTYESPAFRSLPEKYRIERTGMAYGATDFARLDGIKPIPHKEFTVGYIGTLDFMKMHSDFVALSTQVKIPDVKFIVCGEGGAIHTLKEQISAAHRDDSFIFTGTSKDIRPVLELVDVYGYRLCEETYAASELNLQEVMFAGIPPVVFPHGGVRHFGSKRITGLVVHSAREYGRQLNICITIPKKRLRLGRNAKEYATQILDLKKRQLNSIAFTKKYCSLQKLLIRWEYHKPSLLHHRPVEPQ